MTEPGLQQTGRASLYASGLLDVVRATTGMEFTEGRLDIAERRLNERREALHASSWMDYRRFLEADPAEMRRVIELLAVNETFFYRHRSQLLAVRDRVLSPLAAEARRTGQPVRIWSAACANGCEAYTLAILCQELIATSGPFPYEIIGTDIDAAAVVDAERGVYSEREVSVELPPMLRDAFLTPRPDGTWAVRDVLRQNIRFLYGNLLVDIPPAGCSLVICRNVLYYFPEAVRRRILSKLWGAMSVGAILVFAPTESVLGLDAFFRIADPQNKLLEHWSTAMPAVPGIIGPPVSLRARRRTTAPGNLHIPEEWQRIRLTGNLLDRRDLEPIRVQLTMESSVAGLAAELFRAPQIANSDLVVDATRLRLISNELLHELRELLAELQKTRRANPAASGTPNVRLILCAEERQRLWFEHAGFRTVVPDIRLASEISERTTRVRLKRHDSAEHSGRAETREPATPLVIRSGTAAPRRPMADTSVSPPEFKVIRLFLPVDAHHADPASFRRTLSGALEDVARMPGARIRIDAGSCIFLDEVHARAIARFIGSLPADVPVELSHASQPVSRLLARHTPAARFRS